MSHEKYFYESFKGIDKKVYLIVLKPLLQNFFVFLLFTFVLYAVYFL